jgi:nanoRNase/pAp phosphatase (c-di-AMP/oligoRNAs hydrolase)
MDKVVPRESLERVLASVVGEPLVILISGSPDPDAIGGAMAHQRICDSLGVPATIAHVQPISLRENRALVKLLNLDMVQVNSTADLAKYKHLSLVDTSSPGTAIELPPDLKVLTVVDHHRAAKLDAPFSDVRPQIGATSSIYARGASHGERRRDGGLGPRARQPASGSRFCLCRRGQRARWRSRFDRHRR